MAETAAKKDSLITKLDKVLTPIGQKLGNEKHLQAISNGMLFGLPFLVIGSFFLIVVNPPIVLDRYKPRTANIFYAMACWLEILGCRTLCSNNYPIQYDYGNLWYDLCFWYCI